ncbi:Mitochondrial zinc maintenance protein 1, mitochondrial [Agyrium rufum]|nr:Mitochondrial zinc maintenance protein 1, mitochondrial [Agyrium rufum]
MATAAYRQILRATRIAFRDDHRMLISARHQVRSTFQLDRDLPPSSAEVSEKIAHAQDVAKILRQNVVQGKRAEGSLEEEQRFRESTTS